MQAADTNALSRETPTGIGGLQAEDTGGLQAQDTGALSRETPTGIGGLQAEDTGGLQAEDTGALSLFCSLPFTGFHATCSSPPTPPPGRHTYQPTPHKLCGHRL